jgi:dTDP-4-amino-4,6-dideoxygalactose transaminase
VLNADALKVSVKDFVKAMEAEGVPVYGVQWPEMYREKAFVEQNGFGALKYPFRDPNARQIDYTQFDCQTAQWLSQRTMSFFTHPVYEEKHMEAYVTAFNKVAAALMK